MRSGIAAGVASLVFFVSGPGAAAEAARSAGPEASFESLQLALLLRQPDAVRRLLTKRSVRYYDHLLETARRGPGARPDAKLSFEERVVVNALRGYAPEPILASPTAFDAFSSVLLDERLTFEPAQQLRLERLAVEGDRAVSGVAYDRTPTPFVVHYRREAGEWKIDGIHVAPAFVSLLETLGVSSDADPENLRSAMAMWESVQSRLVRK